MKTKSRLYVLTDKQGGSIVNVRATNPAQALNYATRDRFSIRVATVEDALSMDKASILDATNPSVHPDQLKMEGV